MLSNRASLLLELVQSNAPDCEDRVQKMIEWKYTHAVDASKLVLGALLSLLASLLLAFIKQTEVKNDLLAGTSAFGAVVLTGVWFYLFYGLRNVDEEYVIALKLLNVARARPEVIEELPTLAGSM